MNWSTLPHPEATSPSLMTDVLQSPQVLVQCNGTYALAVYQVHLTHPEIFEEQGHWRVDGHNGNWDKHVKQWAELPPLTTSLDLTEAYEMICDIIVQNESIHSLQDLKKYLKENVTFEYTRDDLITAYNWAGQMVLRIIRHKFGEEAYQNCLKTSGEN